MPAAVEIARWLIVLSLSVVLVFASISDIRHRRIPNWTVLAVIVLFVPWVFVSAQVSILSALEAALVAFLMSCCLYVFRVVGAGDSKLLTATALFAGSAQLMQFLILVAMAGGAIAVVSLAMEPTRALVMFQMRGKAPSGRDVPYGVAIAIAAICVVIWPLFRNAYG